MSAHAVVKGCVGVAKVLPYILNMLVRPVDQLAMLSDFPERGQGNKAAVKRKSG